jgi:hypothetical protein
MIYFKAMSLKFSEEGKVNPSIISQDSRSLDPCSNPGYRVMQCPCAQLIEHYGMKEHKGVDVSINVFLTSAQNGGKWSASRSGRFTHEEKAPVPNTQMVWLTPEPIWTTWRSEKRRKGTE